MRVEFEHGNKVSFKMRDFIKTMPHSTLKDILQVLALIYVL